MEYLILHIKICSLLPLPLALIFTNVNLLQCACIWKGILKTKIIITPQFELVYNNLYAEICNVVSQDKTSLHSQTDNNDDYNKIVHK